MANITATSPWVSFSSPMAFVASIAARTPRMNPFANRVALPAVTALWGTGINPASRAITAEAEIPLHPLVVGGGADPAARAEILQRRLLLDTSVELSPEEQLLDALAKYRSGGTKADFGATLESLRTSDPKFRLSFAGQDLRGLDLGGLDFGANADFSYADLRGADLSGASFIDPVFIGADLRDVRMSAETVFSRCNGLNWDGTNLLGSQFDLVTWPSRNFFNPYNNVKRLHLWAKIKYIEGNYHEALEALDLAIQALTDMDSAEIEKIHGDPDFPEPKERFDGIKSKVLAYFYQDRGLVKLELSRQSPEPDFSAAIQDFDEALARLDSSGKIKNEPALGLPTKAAEWRDAYARGNIAYAQNDFVEAGRQFERALALGAMDEIAALCVSLDIWQNTLGLENILSRLAECKKRAGQTDKAEFYETLFTYFTEYRRLKGELDIDMAAFRAHRAKFRDFAFIDRSELNPPTLLDRAGELISQDAA
ncbi:MAG: pentapeptide repeat-containing protein [bacterium]